MKINIESYLHTIDTYFEEKSQKDTYMTYAMVITIIFAFSYLLFWDSSFNEFEKSRKTTAVLHKRIHADETFLRLNPVSKIAQMEQAIKDINKKIISYKDSNDYIKSKIETISALVYDERAWGEYLHSISINAQKNNVKILNFTNKYVDNNNSFGHLLNISLHSEGSYKNTLNFINSLEQSDLVVDIHSLVLEAQENLKSDLNISVWGIIY